MVLIFVSFFNDLKWFLCHFMVLKPTTICRSQPETFAGEAFMLFVSWFVLKVPRQFLIILNHIMMAVCLTKDLLLHFACIGKGKIQPIVWDLLSLSIILWYPVTWWEEKIGRKGAEQTRQRSCCIWSALCNQGSKSLHECHVMLISNCNCWLLSTDDITQW